MPIPLNQPLPESLRPRRDTDKRNNRPTSGSSQYQRRSLSSAVILPEEESSPPPAPPLPAKKISLDGSSSTSLVENGFTTAPRRRLRTSESTGLQEDESPPDKPPLSPCLGNGPDLPPKINRVRTPPLKSAIPKMLEEGDPPPSDVGQHPDSTLSTALPYLVGKSSFLQPPEAAKEE